MSKNDSDSQDIKSLDVTQPEFAKLGAAVKQLLVEQASPQVIITGGKRYIELPDELSDPAQMRAQIETARAEATKFLMPYRFAISEINTKLNILQDEFAELKQYNPIDSVSSRLKSFESILEKITRRRLHPDPETLKQQLTDIAGVRVVCSFISDVYRVQEMLAAQHDITVLKIKDYIANPKPNGYRSLHMLVEVPVFLSSGPVDTIVEVQIRTKAMDFWASLEHKIYYKYARTVPEHLTQGLVQAAETANELDEKMQELHLAIRGENV